MHNSPDARLIWRNCPSITRCLLVAAMTMSIATIYPDARVAAALFGPQFLLSAGVPGLHTELDVRSDGAGNWVAVWLHADAGDTDIATSRSVDGARSWSAATTLNTNAPFETGLNGSPRIATDGDGTWLAVWASTDTFFGTLGSDSDILVARSTDAGASWSAPQPVATNAPIDSDEDTAPTLATDGAGAWIVSWQGSFGRVLSARSVDGGVTWSDPVVLYDVIADFPVWPVRSACDTAGRCVVIWTGYETYVARSADGGVSWTLGTLDVDGEPLQGTVMDVAPTAEGELVAAADRYDDGLGAHVQFSVRSVDGGASWIMAGTVATNPGVLAPARLADAPGGRVVAVWLTVDTPGSVTGNDRDVFFSTSESYGSSWSTVRPANSDAAHDGPAFGWGDDFAPVVATDGQGVWVAGWHGFRDAFSSDIDVMIAVGYTAEQTVSPSRFDQPASVDPRVAADPGGHWVAVWTSYDNGLSACNGGSQNGKVCTVPADCPGASCISVSSSSNIFTSRSSDAVSWQVPAVVNAAVADGHDNTRPYIATNGSGTWVTVWETYGTPGGVGPDADVSFARSEDYGAFWSFPARLNGVESSDIDDDYTPVVAAAGATWIAAWASNDADGDLYFARSADDGVMWSASQALNTNAGSDAGSDAWPHLATDGAGTWVAVWESTDALGGTIGTDYDILTARSTDDGVTWSAPAPLTPGAVSDGAAVDIEARIAHANGTWVAVWTHDGEPGDPLGTDQDILFTRSIDGGVSWSSPEPVYAYAGVDARDDREPQLAVDGAGRWTVVWGSDDGSERDALTAHSDDGATWTAPLPVEGSDAYLDDEDEADARVATDGTNWLWYWSEYVPADGDPDVFFAARGRCGDGSVSSYEECDDGNTADGDCCSATCKIVGTGAIACETQSETANGGDTVTTDGEVDGATPGDPWETSVTVPNGGTVSVTEVTGAGIAPLGFSFGGPQVRVEAPDGSAASPLVIRFRLDASITFLGQEALIRIIRNGVAVPECTGAPATASPDPCVASRERLPDDDIEITVLTSRASVWNVGNRCRRPIVPRKARLQLLDRSPDSKDLMTWKWSSGEATATADYGNPLSDEGYALRVVDGTGRVVLSAHVAPGGTCGGKPCWKTTGTSGFGYTDGTAASDGIQKIALKGGIAGKAKIQAKSKGEALPMPALPLALPVTVELRADSGTCWEATYSASGVTINDATRFKAAAD